MCESVCARNLANYWILMHARTGTHKALLWASRVMSLSSASGAGWQVSRGKLSARAAATTKATKGVTHIKKGCGQGVSRRGRQCRIFQFSSFCVSINVQFTSIRKVPTTAKAYTRTHRHTYSCISACMVDTNWHSDTRAHTHKHTQFLPTNVAL